MKTHSSLAGAALVAALTLAAPNAAFNREFHHGGSPSQAHTAAPPPDLAAAWLSQQAPAPGPGATSAKPIPLDQLGAMAGQQYTGDGLAVTATPAGARLRCVFQKLDGEATPEGLWLVSTVPGSPAGKFRVVGSAIGDTVLPKTGKVEAAEGLARFIRPGLTEEYSVSVNGVRQDFVVAQRPAAGGELRVGLALSGARAETAAYGAKLTLEGSGRALAYSRLRVTDAQGKDLPATIQVLDAQRLAVVVEDAGAAYPVRIDPTFSDANWSDLGGGASVGTDGVRALAISGSTVYVGGDLGGVGPGVAANYVAKWDGTNWSALSSGMNGPVYALAVGGDGTLYAGGRFTTAGGVSAKAIAKWDGSSWSPLGAGVATGAEPTIMPRVNALAVMGNKLFVGGDFSYAGGVGSSYSAYSIAQWNINTSSWSTGSGTIGSFILNDGQEVNALAVMGTDLYAAGFFGNIGPTRFGNIGKWNGTSWSKLGDGLRINDRIFALAVSGSSNSHFGTARRLVSTL